MPNRAYKPVIILSIVFAVCLMAFNAALASEVVNRVVAIVGDDVITSMDLEKVLEQTRAQLEMMNRSGQAAQVSPSEVRAIAIDRIIDEKIFDQEVERLGLRVGEEEIDAFINRIKRMNNLSEEQFVSHLNRRALTPDEYRDQVKNDLLKRKLINKEVKSRVVITDEQVIAEYNKNKENLKKQGAINLQAVFLRVDEKAGDTAVDAIRKRLEDLRKQVADGGDMAEIAKKYSQGPGAANGGMLGPVSADDLLPEMRLAISKMKAGELSDVIQVPGGFVFMRLMERSGTSNMPDEKEVAQIRMQMENQALENKFKEWMKELRANTYVKIME